MIRKLTYEELRDAIVKFRRQEVVVNPTHWWYKRYEVGPWLKLVASIEVSEDLISIRDGEGEDAIVLNVLPGDEVWVEDHRVDPVPVGAVLAVPVHWTVVYGIGLKQRYFPEQLLKADVEAQTPQQARDCVKCIEPFAEIVGVVRRV